MTDSVQAPVPPQPFVADSVDDELEATIPLPRYRPERLI